MISKHQKPTNDEDRICALRSSVLQGEQANAQFVPAETLEAIQHLLPQFEAARQADKAALVAAQTNVEALHQARVAHKLARKAVATQRAEAERLYEQVYQALNQALCNESTSARRQIMRLYGIGFGNIKEQVERSEEGGESSESAEG